MYVVDAIIWPPSDSCSTRSIINGDNHCCLSVNKVNTKVDQFRKFGLHRFREFGLHRLRKFRQHRFKEFGLHRFRKFGTRWTHVIYGFQFILASDLYPICQASIISSTHKNDFNYWISLKHNFKTLVNIFKKACRQAILYLMKIR